MSGDAATRAMQKLANEDTVNQPASATVGKPPPPPPAAAAMTPEVVAPEDEQEASLIVIPAYGTPEKALGDYVSVLGLTLPEELNFTDYQLFGNGIRTFTESGMWIVGDYLNYGVDHFGEDIASQVVDSLGYTEQSLAIAKSVSKAIPMSERRQSLSFAHHQSVAYLDSEKREMWLDRAIENEWSRDELRDQIRQAEGKEKLKRGRPVGSTKSTRTAKARAEAMSMIQMVAFVENNFKATISDSVEEMIVLAKLAGPMVKGIESGEGFANTDAKKLFAPIDQTLKILAKLREQAEQVAAFEPPKEKAAKAPKAEKPAKAPKAKKAGKKAKAAPEAPQSEATA